MERVTFHKRKMLSKHQKNKSLKEKQSLVNFCNLPISKFSSAIKTFDLV